jgi:pimeloyl-ACP methyl ester carboxylesterase
MSRTNSRKLRFAAVSLVAAAVLAVGVSIPAVASATVPAERSHAVNASPKPTIVLVHGAWADGSSFAPITALLQRDGYTVMVAPNPLRGLASDSASLAAFVNQSVSGPVVLVGHSYGGAVITDGALSIPTVTALVYVDAYAPAQGESVLQLTGAEPGSVLGASPPTIFNFVQYPGAPAGDVDTYIKQALFPSFFAAHLPKAISNVLASGQEPVALSALTAPSTAPAWATIKSFFFIGSQDAVLPPAEQLNMAHRAKGTIVEAKADHLSMLEQPLLITNLIERAAK